MGPQGGGGGGGRGKGTVSDSHAPGCTSPRLGDGSVPSPFTKRFLPRHSFPPAILRVGPLTVPISQAEAWEAKGPS